MDKSTYVGPYARCYSSKNGEPDNWAHEKIIEATKAERLYYANGEAISKPALFAPNVSYDGQMESWDALEDGGQMELKFAPVADYIGAFNAAFVDEITVLQDYFERVEIVFGVIVTWR